ncbi:hypothetical protein BH10PLA2_BH10PLA2_24080 [soil metagenome]
MPTPDWFYLLTSSGALAPASAVELHERGFVIIPGPYEPNRMHLLAMSYTSAMASAASEGVKVGTTSTRVNDFVNRGSAFDELYMFPPLIVAACRVVGRPFKLSSFHARTLRPHMPSQGFHVDVQRDSVDWPLLGFILMVDDFRPDNGATCFVPGSHCWLDCPPDLDLDLRAVTDREVRAVGNAGSLIIFHGSTWHGHSANRSDCSRRSLQGAFIPQGGNAATNFAARMRPETLARLGPLARRVLDI